MNKLKSILILGYLNICYGIFTQGNRIINHQQIANPGVARSYEFASMISFPNNIFATSYHENTQSRLVVQFLQNGQQLPGSPTGFVTHQGTQTTLGLIHMSMCAFNNDAYVMYSYHNQTSEQLFTFARGVRQDGTFIGPEFQIPITVGELMLYNQCLQIGPTDLLFYYSIRNFQGGTTWYDMFLTVYNPTTPSFTAQVRINNDNLPGQQLFSNMIRLTTGNYILTLQSDTGGFDLYEFDTNLNIQNGGNRVLIAGGGVNNHLQNMQPLANGNFVLTYGDRTNLYYQVFDQNLIQLCPETILSTAITNFHSLMVHNDLAYIVYHNTAPQQQIAGIVFDPIACTTISTNTIYQGAIQQQTLSAAISQDTDSVQSVVITLQFEEQTVPPQMVIYEFLVEQQDTMGNQIDCPNDARCLGCYGSYTCPVCIGSDENNKVIRQNGVNNCTCDDLYYDDFPNNIDCQQCQFPCANCLSDTQCLTCQTTDPNMGTDCACNFQYSRLNSDTLCSQCSHKCESCLGNINTCGNCSHTTRQMPNNCDCEPGTYDDGSNYACVPCNYPCQTCSDGSTCLSCQTPSNRISSTNCNCQQGYYETGSQCSQCNPQCLSCTGSPDNCTPKCSRKCWSCTGNVDNCIVSCDPSCYYCDWDGKCTHCSIGYYLENNQCKTCHKKCLDCKNQSDNCQKCAKGKHRNLDLSQNCACLDGYYDIGEKDCAKCPTYNCLKCNDQGLCLQCLNSNMDPSKQCRIEYSGSTFTFISGSQVKVGHCSIKCLECKDNKDNCIKCRQGLNRINDKLPCKCKSGYHDSHGSRLDCELCYYTCLECSDYQGCTKCDSNQNRKLNPFYNTCDCRPGYYENRITGLCQQCYMYNGECLSVCPLNTSPDNQLYICQGQQFQLEQNMWTIFVCAIVLIFSMVIVTSTLALITKQKYLGSQINSEFKQQFDTSYKQN